MEESYLQGTRDCFIGSPGNGLCLGICATEFIFESTVDNLNLPVGTQGVLGGDPNKLLLKAMVKPRYLIPTSKVFPKIQ